MKLSVDDIMGLNPDGDPPGPCDDYPREQIEALFAGRERLSLAEIAQLDIPRVDVWWGFCMIATKAQARHLACWCGRRDLERRGLWDDAPQVVQEYLLSYGEREELRDAARNVAWDAARDAAGNAAWNAARNAAGNASWYAARDAVWEEQIAYAVEYLEAAE